MQAESKHYVFKTESGAVEYWASKGRVFVVDLTKAGDSEKAIGEQIKSMSPKEFMERAMAVRISADERYPDEVFNARQLLTRAVEVCKIAWHFGDPTSQKVLSHLSRHRSHPQILMPGDILPAIGGGKLKLPEIDDPKQAILTGKGVAPIPDFSLSGSQLLTPARANKLRKRR